MRCKELEENMAKIESNKRKTFSWNALGHQTFYSDAGGGALVIEKFPELSKKVLDTYPLQPVFTE